MRLLPLKNKTRPLKLLTITKMFGSFDDNLRGFEKNAYESFKDACPTNYSYQAKENLN